MKYLILKGIRFYQHFISPYFAPSCRFSPTCSSYAFTAIEQHGFFRGGKMALIRIFKCHPFHPGGYDPVPEKEKNSV